MKEISKSWQQIGEELAYPFAPSEIDWKPGSVTRDKTKALALAYLNARSVMDRLDSVVGPGNWQDSYRIVADGNHVECTLTIDGVSKSDVGEPSGSDFADKVKGAYSDSLKRAAVKFGVGRYLYRLDGQWVDYDAQRKQLTRIPTLPAWALPEGVSEEPSDNGQSNGNGKKLMAPVKFVEYVAEKLGFEDPQHVRATMKLLGIKAVPQNADARKVLYEALEAYRDMRDVKKLSQDDALAALQDEPTETKANA